tara:strand:+ start:129 stop:371 length:243 start_codon:yes stop_codon:yes gene_type:complete
MKLVTWKRDKGYVSVCIFDNKTSCAVSRKVFATKVGAEKMNARVLEHCGSNYENDFPWSVTDTDTGNRQQLFNRENVAKV